MNDKTKLNMFAHVCLLIALTFFCIFYYELTTNGYGLYSGLSVFALMIFSGAAVWINRIAEAK